MGQPTKKTRKWRSAKKEKILTLLVAGVALLLTRTHRQQLRLAKSLSRVWKNINRQDLYRLLHEFREEKVVSFDELGDGSIKIVVTERGRQRVLQFDVDRLQIRKPARWDKRWRIILFDIPERRRAARDAFRDKLKDLGCHEWQRSVFIHPFPCRDEIEFLIEFYEIRPHVRFAELINPLNEAELKLRFNLG